MLRIIILALFLKLAYFSFSLLVPKFNPKYETACTLDEFLYIFKKNDAYWYEKIAEKGYPKITNDLDLGYSIGPYFKQSEWAQFPLYPLMAGGLEKIFGLSFDQSAFIISLVFSLSSFIGFFLLCLYLFRLDDKTAFFCTLVFMLFPFHYYFSVYYTEALYFSFMAFAFISLNRKIYWLASLLLIPLTLIRPNGTVTVLPLFVYFIETEGGFKLFWKRLLGADKKLMVRSALFFSAPFALAIYCIYQKYMTGHYFAYVMAQYGWYKEFMIPFLGLFRRGDLTTQFNSVYIILVMVLAVFLWKKLPLSMNLLIWLSILLPMTSGSVACMPRYVSVIFPFTVYIGLFLAKMKFRMVICGILFLLQLLVFYPWLLSHPFSY
ncbi:MAG TPA: hypothetical protein VNY73_06830 [Bacteroidia bacterium]|nr:hypothetical protein [Bacteroidia bacterium]